jgi:hypothetical protein
MVFKNEKQLESFLLAKCKSAVAKTQDIALQDVVRQAEAFYGDYTPVCNGYDRTYQLKSVDKFIQKSPIVSDKSYCEASVYLEEDNLSYTTGKNPSGEQVVNTAVQGLHGVSDGEGWKYVSGNTGVRLWDDQLQSKAMDDLVQMLRVQGIPIKKG